jgi:hypothetical protein
MSERSRPSHEIFHNSLIGLPWPPAPEYRDYAFLPPQPDEIDDLLVPIDSEVNPEITLADDYQEDNETDDDTFRYCASSYSPSPPRMLADPSAAGPTLAGQEVTDAAQLRQEIAMAASQFYTRMGAILVW